MELLVTRALRFNEACSTKNPIFLMSSEHFIVYCIVYSIQYTLKADKGYMFIHVMHYNAVYYSVYCIIVHHNISFFTFLLK